MKKQEPIRVAQIIGKWLGGGVESVVMNYYRHIDRSKIQFDFICDEDSTNIPYEEIEKLGGKVILIPPYQKIFKYHKELKKILKEGNYKIVHSHINTLSVFSLFAAKCAGVPVRIAHSHSTTNKQEKKKNLVKQVLRPFSKVFATDYMACTEHAGRWLFGNKEYDNGNVYLLNNAIDLDKFKYDEKLRKEKRKELNIKEDTLVIGHVGRFVEQKNHRFLIDIFNEVHKQNKNSILLLIGQGPLMEEMKEKVDSLGISDSVKFLGQREDVSELYNAMDLFLFPSLYEGLGMVLIEAQANGLPCIASTEVPKIADISNNVQFYNLNDSIDIWLKNYDIKRFKFIQKNCIYDIKKEAEKLENIYYKEKRSNMKLLFIQGGSRVSVSNNGSFYVDGNFNNNIWLRYSGYANDKVNVILRKNSGMYEEKKLMNKLNKIDTNIVNLKLVDDIYKPKINFFNIKKRLEIRKLIKQEIVTADRVIIRSIGNFYTNTALKYCKKYKKKYLIEFTGFAFEGLWYHSFLGKIFAIPRELKLKNAAKNAPYAVYVTEKSLQKRYPCRGNSLGCSDVELIDMNLSVLEEKLKRIDKNDGIYKMGTAAFLNVKWKGIQDVLKALYLLKKKGITNFRYELIGAGSPEYLNKLINKYDLGNQVKILGTKKHEEVFEWLRQLDIYIQPSYQEGLCRAIVEAMSQACPCVVSNAGGNVELIDEKFIFQKGNVNSLLKILSDINKEALKNQATKNYEHAKNYKKELLDDKRMNFYKKFMDE